MYILVALANQCDWGVIEMNRAWQTIVMVSAASMSAQAFAVDSIGHAPSPKRLLIACMSKQMSASKTLSYNEATKLCKAQLKSQSATLASSTAVKPMSGLNR
jgi:hypothetical protein